MKQFGGTVEDVGVCFLVVICGRGTEEDIFSMITLSITLMSPQ